MMKSHWRTYTAWLATAVAIGAASLALQWVTEPYFVNSSTLIFGLIGVAVSAWLLNHGAAMVTLAIVIAGNAYLFLNPYTDPADAISLALHAVSGWIVSVLIDLLDQSRRRATDALHALEKQRKATSNLESRLDEALNSVADPIALLRSVRGEKGQIVDFVIEYINEAGAQTNIDFPLQRKEQIGRRLTEIVPRVRELGLIEEYARVAETGDRLIRTVEVMPMDRDATVPLVQEVRAHPVGDGLLVQWRDMTPARRAQESLRLSEQRYRSLVNATAAIVWVTSATGMFETEQLEWTRFTGQSFEELRGWGWLNALHPDDREEVAKIWSVCVAERTPYQVEYRLRAADGEYRNMSVRAVPLINERGGVREWIGVCTDVSEHLRAEQMVADSERHLRRVLDSLFTFVGVLTCDGTLLSTNDAPLRAGGLKPEDVVGRKFWDTFWWTHSEDTRQQLRDSIVLAAQGEVSRFDVEVCVAGGATITVDFMITPMRDEQGQITHLIPSGVDISARKRAERSLRESEEQLRAFFESSASGMVLTDSSSRFLRVNDAFCRFLGYKREELGEMDLVDVCPAEAQPRERADLKELLSGRGSPFSTEKQFARKDGSIAWAQADLAVLRDPDGGPQRIAGVIIDTTDRKRDEAALGVSEERFRDAFTHAPFGMTITALDGQFLHVNEAFCQIVGYDETELLSGALDFNRLTQTNDQPAVRQLFESMLAARIPTFTAEQVLSRREGQPVWVRVSASLRPDASGRAPQVLCLIEDVTARKTAEVGLADRERHYRQLTEGLPQLVWTSQPDGACDFLNGRWAEYTGVTVEKLLGYGWLDVVHPQDREVVLEAWKLSLASSKPMAVEFRIQGMDGTFRWFDTRALPLRNSAGDVVRWFGTNLDVDDRKKAQQEIILLNQSLELRIAERTAEAEARSEQLRALALDLAETESRERKRLAQLLHDHFQQLLSAAKLKVGIVRRRSEDGPSVTSLREIEGLLEETINASRSLATELSPPVLHDAGLAAALEWLARHMQRDHNLTVHVEVDERCEPDNEQVRTIMFECARELLFNVVKHAGVTHAFLSLSMPHEGLVQLRVQDRGRGFDANRTAVNRTPDGSFGLFSIKERLSLIGGLVRLRSAAGEGTTAELTVPVTLREQTETAKRRPVDLPGKSNLSLNDPKPMRVLVADDHKLFREGLISLLSQESYVTVVGQAGDGAEAVELARQLRPDVMICDVTMPKLNGVQVTSTIAKEFPEIKIIGLSMHERDDMARAMRDAGAVAYCTKGGPTEVLLGILRSVATETTVPAGG